MRLDTPQNRRLSMEVSQRSYVHELLATDDGAMMPDDTEKDAAAQMRLIRPEHPPTVASVPVDLDRLWKATLATIQLPNGTPGVQCLISRRGAAIS